MNIGKVHDYNSLYGKIITDKDIYTFSYYALDDNIKNGDIVQFKIGDKQEKVAIDVKKYQNQDIKTLMRNSIKDSKNYDEISKK